MRRGKLKATAFSLVEVVIALAICSFTLITILGLFGSTVQSNRESEAQIRAADLASLIVSMRAAATTNSLPNFAIPDAALSTLYGNAYASGTSSYVGGDGYLTNAANALYAISCQCGTNALTGPALVQVYLRLSWPPQAAPADAAGQYESLTTISLK